MGRATAAKDRRRWERELTDVKNSRDFTFRGTPDGAWETVDCADWRQRAQRRGAWNAMEDTYVQMTRPARGKRQQQIEATQSEEDQFKARIKDHLYQDELLD